MSGIAVSLIQGSNRGIGLEFVKQLSKRSNSRVIACCRNPNQATELEELSRSQGNITLKQLDVTDEVNVRNVAESLTADFGKLDLAINVSGILHPSGKGETRLSDVTMNAMNDTFTVNTFGPLMMAKYLTPLLQKGEGLIGSQVHNKNPKLCHKAILVNMSARVGSISDNQLGGWYSYRMSKAALNMANKCLSIELGRGKNRSICLCLHPGTVDTDLSRPYHKGVPKGKLFTKEYSVTKLMEIIDNATFEDTGRCIAWDGQIIPF